MEFKTPILFLIFNRPDTTEKVFAQIKKIKPKQFYIAADGPRPSCEGEAERCQKAKEVVIQNIDWDCDVKTLFRDRNLGCRKAVSSAVDWFFDNVDEGIILEDDCLPDISFFHYCENLLDFYRNDKRIMHISGSNFCEQVNNLGSSESYFFSKTPDIWGWATWKRAWEKYDVNIEEYQSYLTDSKKLKEKFKIRSYANFWSEIFPQVFLNNFDTWDYQWMFTILHHDGLAVIPFVNLISNIGTDEYSTHTAVKSMEFNHIFHRTTGELTAINHPEVIAADPNTYELIMKYRFQVDKNSLIEFAKKLKNRYLALSNYRIYKKIYRTFFQ